MLDFYGKRHTYTIFVFTSSLYVAIYTYLNGYLIGDFFEFSIKNYYLYIFYFFIFFLFIMYYDFLYLLLIKVNINSEFKFNYSIKTNKLGKLLLFYQVFYIFFNFYYDMNTAGTITRVDNPIKYIFLIINPDYIFLIYICILSAQLSKLNNLCMLNITAFIVSNVFMRGWFFYLVFFLFIFLFRNTFLLRRRFYYFIIFMFFLVGLLFSPYLYYMRSLIRMKLEIDVEYINMQDYKSLLIYSINSLIARFDSISSIYYFFDEVYPIDISEVKGMYAQGIFLSNMYDTMGYNGEPISRILVKESLGSYSREYSEGNTAFMSTIIPYFFIGVIPTIFHYLYFHFLVIVSAICSRIISDSGVFFLNWFMGVSLLISGWSGAYLSFLITQLFFILFLGKLSNKH